MSVTYVGSLRLSDIFPLMKLLMDLKIQLDLLLKILVTLEGGFDFVINAPFGLGALKLGVLLDFQGALKAIASLSISMSNPLADAAFAISAMGQLMVNLQAALKLGLPTVSAELGLSLSALLAVSAAASAKLAGIQLVIDAVLSLLAPLIDAKLTLGSINIPGINLNDPGVYMYSGATPYSTFQPVLGAPPSGITTATNMQTVILMVDPVGNPSATQALKAVIPLS